MANILLWLLAVEILGLIALPLGYLLFRRLPDRGLALAPVFGLLLASYLYWVLGLTGLVENSRYVIIGILLAIALASGLVVRRHGAALAAFLWQERLHLGVGQVLFLAVFALWAAVASQVPAINHTEKPMDFGFLNAVVLADSFPPEDMWLAGHTVSYYYFGHLMMGGLTKLTGIASSVSYNLSLALIAALMSLAAYGLIYNLVRLAGARPLRAVLFALAAPVFIGLIGHLVGVLDFVQAQGWGSEGFWQWVNIKDLSRSAAESASFFPQDYNWWWHSTRVIDTVVGLDSLDFTITEFPFFSFLLGDLHAHVLSLPFVVLSLSLSLNLYLGQSPLGLEWLKRHVWEALALSLSLGALAFINIWDLPVYAALFAALLLARALREQASTVWIPFLKAGIVAAPILGLAVLMFLPFYLDLQSQASGILPLEEVSTRPFYFFLIWGLFLVITVPFVLRQLWSLPRQALLDEGSVTIAVVVTLLPVVLWAGLAFFLILADDGLGDAAKAVGSRFGKLLPLIVLVGLSVFSALARARSGPHPVVFGLALTALGYYLLMGVEMFYLEDFLPLRMNTVFKLTYQAWLLLALASAFGVYHWISQPLPRAPALKLGSHVLVGVTVLLLLGSLYYPAGAALDRVKSSNDSPTLDGLAYVKRQDPAEYEAILRLRDSAPRGRLVEAVGGDYSDHGRVAAATGLPSLLNWPGHELQWRGSSVPFNGREEDVAAIYQSQDPEEVGALLERYGVRYVYVGVRERAKYGFQGLGAFPSLMEVYFHRGSVTVYMRNHGDQDDGLLDS